MQWFHRQAMAHRGKVESKLYLSGVPEKNIFTRFGVPLKIITDNASTFRSSELV